MQYWSMLVSFTLMLSVLAESNHTQVYIASLDNESQCKHRDEPCFTLNGFQNHFEDFSTQNITLMFLSGEHLLSWNMTFYKYNSVVLHRGEKSDSNPQIKCQASSRIDFIHTNTVSIGYLNFTGCQRGAVNFVNTTNVTVSFCSFTNNSAINGGAICATGPGNMTVESSSFVGNKALVGGGAIYGTYNLLQPSQQISLYHSAFVWNKAGEGGAVLVDGIALTVTESKFIENKAKIFKAREVEVFNDTGGHAMGGAILTTHNFFSSLNSQYISNSAEDKGIGGAIVAIMMELSLLNGDIFHNNTATTRASALYFSCRQMPTRISIIHNTTFSNNGVSDSVLCITSQMNFTGEVQVINNLATTVFIESSVDFYGHTLFSNNTQGAITSIQSTITFHSNSTTSITGNKNTYGGGINLRGGWLVSQGMLNITDNNASKLGGGIYAYQSSLVFQSDRLVENDTDAPQTNIIGNTAKQSGGGMYLTATSIEISTNWLCIYENSAKQNGGGLFLEHTSLIYLNKVFAEDMAKANQLVIKLDFKDNYANYGGAIYVADISNADQQCEGVKAEAGEAMSECFLQVQALYPHENKYVKKYIYNNTFFTNNTAQHSGGDIYGGLLDRCTPSPYTELTEIFNISSFTGLKIIEKIAWFDWAKGKNFMNISRLYKHISSDAVQLCFCSDNITNCSFQNRTVTVKKGHTFSISVAIVDQVGHILKGTVISSFWPHKGKQNLKEGQQNQPVQNRCKTLQYNVYSNLHNTTMQLYPDGPCANRGISKRSINITFKPCDCPTGFERTSIHDTCDCTCDRRLKPFVDGCFYNDSKSKIEVRNFWITYVNRTRQRTKTEFLILGCPYDYCAKIPINISLQDTLTIDKQCAFNRTGMLCGKCEEGLSNVFGNSNCKQCSDYFLLLLLPFALAGIALVTFILYFNMTVAVGTINGLILYANIVAANRHIFLPLDSTNFLTVFISWLNLDLGIETCFYNGMDSYTKALLQLVFPAYLFVITGLIIVLCEYSGRFGSLLARRNPVATLCTLILLSYSKLFRSIITFLQYTTITYPDNSTEYVWLYDSNVPYYQLSRIPMFLIAAIIITVGVVYTSLLLSAQYLQRYSHKILLRWVRKPKYNAFIDAYQAPFTPKHRYWFGLTLLVRIVHFLISAFLSDTVTILSVGVIILVLLLLKLYNKTIYKSKLNDFLETSFFTALMVLSLATYYVRESNSNQTVLAYISMATSFLGFLFILCYHFSLYVLKIKNIPSVLKKLTRRFQRYEVIDGSNDEELENADLLYQNNWVRERRLQDKPIPTQTVISIH